MKYKGTKIKTFFTLIAAVVLIFSAILFGGTNYADAKALPDKYFSFDKAGAVCAYGGYIYVSDKNALNVFESDGAFKIKIALGADATALSYDNGKLYILKSDGIYQLVTDGISENQSPLLELFYQGEFTDIAAGSGKVYAAGKDGVIEIGETDKQTNVISSSPAAYISIKTAESEGISISQYFYAAINAENSEYYDIYGKSGLVFDFVPAFFDMAAFGEDTLNFAVIDKDGNIGVLTEDGFDLNKLEDVSALCPYADGFDKGYYAVTKYGELYSVSESGQVLLTASKSSGDNYFKYPVQTASRLNKTAVADKLNSRIAVYETKNDTVSAYYINSGDNARPSAVAIDNKGFIYAAFESGKLSGAYISYYTFDYDKPTKTYRLEDGQKAEKLFTDTFDRLFAVISGENGGLYIINEDNSIIADTEGISSAASGYDGKIYISSANDIYSAKEENGIYNFIPLCTFESKITDFDIDGKGNIFALSGQTVYKYDAATKAITTFSIDNSQSPAAITISRSDSAGFESGDILITDKANGSIFTLDSQTFKGEFASASAVSSPDTDTVRKLLFTANLYKNPSESKIVANISLNSAVSTYVFTQKYDLDGNSFFSKVYYVENNKEITEGYIFKNALSASTYEEDLSDGQKGMVLSDKTAVYKYPTIASENLSLLNKNDFIFLIKKVTLNNSVWYTVKVKDKDGQEINGYLQANSLSVNNYIPDTYAIRPQINAEVKTKDTNGADIYILQDGNYVKLSESDAAEKLYDGDKIEVIGIFDSSKPYTKIKFYKEGLGTNECYIKSENVNYYGMSVGQIIAAVIIGFSIIVTLVAVFAAIKLKQKRSD